MAKLMKIGKNYYSDLRMRCNGMECPTPEKQGKHSHRIRRKLSIYQPIALQMLEDLKETGKAQKYPGYTPQKASWNYFKKIHKEFCIQKKRSPQTIYRNELAFRMMEKEKSIQDLSQITPELLQNLITLWESKGKTQSVVTRAIKAIKAAMRIAENKKLIHLQNWRTVEVVDPSARIDYFDVIPFDKILSIVKGWVLTDCVLQGREGLRSGEVYHLEWSDIDFDRHQIIFTSKPHLNWKIKGDRKGKKKRVIPIDEEVEPYLRSIARPHGFVLGADRPKNLKLFYKLLQNAIRRTDVLTHHGKLGNPHILRHTFASHILSNGGTLEELKDLLGHEHIQTTEIYAHLMPHAAISAMKRLPKLCSVLVPLGG